MTTNNIDYKMLLQGLEMIQALSKILLNGDKETKDAAMQFYKEFRLASDGFMEVSYAASTEGHRFLITTELNKYVNETRKFLEDEAAVQKAESTIIKFPSSNSGSEQI